IQGQAGGVFDIPAIRQRQCRHRVLSCFGSIPAATGVSDYHVRATDGQAAHTPARELSMSRIVITGGPGAGKTTLLLALQARGYTIVGDSARTIIQDRRRRGLSPRPNAYEFMHETLRMDIENFVHHAATPGHVFFDRGVLDALCGLDRVSPLNE